MRRTGVWLVALLCVVSFGCARDTDRPEGIAERFLQAVSDLGRPGLRAEAEDRIAEFARAGSDSQRLLEPLTPERPEADARWFSDIEIGRSEQRDSPLASPDTRRVIVPYRVTERIAGGEHEAKRGLILLESAGSSWSVVATSLGTDLAASSIAGNWHEPIDGPDALRLPSQGGPRPARATATHWGVAGGITLALLVLSVLVVERQPTPATRPSATRESP